MLLGVTFLDLDVIVQLFELFIEAVPILSLVFGECFNDFGNSTRNIVGNEFEAFSCQDVIEIHHLNEFVDETFDLAWCPVNILGAFLDLGGGRSAFDQVRTDAVVDMLKTRESR